MKIVGTIHLPTHDLDIGGGGEIGSLLPSMPIIANTIVFVAVRQRKVSFAT